MTHFVGQLETQFSPLPSKIPAIVATAPFWTGPQIFSGSKPSRSFRCPAEACLSQGPNPRNHRRFQSCHRPCDSRCRRNSLKGPGGSGRKCHGSLWHPVATCGAIFKRKPPEVPSQWGSVSVWKTGLEEAIKIPQQKRPWFLDTLYYYYIYVASHRQKFGAELE